MGIYDYIDEMVIKLKEYERINLVEIYRNKIDMQAVIMNNEILEGVRKQMRKIERRNQGIVNGTEKKERGEDDEKKKDGGRSKEGGKKKKEEKRKGRGGRRRT